MSLSGAMREGSVLAPQIYGEYVEMSGDEVIGCCALGAVSLATNTESDLLDFVFPELGYTYTHPITRKVMSLGLIIVDLNDDARWTREQIADWLETQGL